jgi:hypothetical protein
MAKSNKVEEQQEQTDTEEQQNQSQVYDTSMKELVDKQVKDILPVLLPGATYESTLNVEIVRPMMRTDKVYIVYYCGRKHILHIEFESSGNPRMGARMLAYNAILHLEYNLPVISILIYLFKTKMVVTPLRIEGADGIITTFRFRIVPLFLLRAERYVREHITCMYPLLPTMKGATHKLVEVAMKELKEVYKGGDDTLGDFFAYMVILLERVKTIAPLEKQKMKEALNMYNNLWDQSPIIQRMKAASEAVGEAKGEIKGLRKALINVVRIRFPRLTELARERAEQITDAEKLNTMIEQILTAPDEENAHVLLAPTVA